MIRNKIILVWVAISICVLQYSMSTLAVLSGNHIEYKTKTFGALMNGIEEYKKIPMLPPWKIRLFSHASAYAFIKTIAPNSSWDIPNNKFNFTPQEFASWVSGFNALWLFVCFVVIILFAKKPLIWLMGYGIAVCYAWTPAGSDLLFTWDGPILFFWTCVAMLTDYKKRWGLFFVVLVGMGFKQTIIIACLIPLFWSERPIFESLRFSFVLGISCLLFKCLLGLYAGSHTFFVSEELHFDHLNAAHHYWFVANNIHLILQHNINSPIFLDTGLILLVFLLPGAYMQKTVVACFSVCLLFMGVFSEYREFQDMIPIVMSAIVSDLKILEQIA
jgi:hypothetical protein